MPDFENRHPGSPGTLGELRLSSDFAGMAAGVAREVRRMLESASSLEAAYRAWRLALEALSRLDASARREVERLEGQGRFLLGSVRSAFLEDARPGAVLPGAGTPEATLMASQSGEAATRLTSEISERLVAARTQLESAVAHERESLLASSASSREEVKARVARFAQMAPPALRLFHRPVAGGEQAFLQAARPSLDESVLLCFVLSGRLPSRYEFLFDEATEDVSLAPAALYPDEGVPTEAGALRPDAAALAACLQRHTDVLPVRGFIPLELGGVLHRLRQRGAVLEVEVSEEAGFRSLLTHAEAERVTGALLRLRLEGRLRLELEL